MTTKRRKARRGRPLKNDAAPDMRERILDAAEDHFSRHGFWGVTIREVAQQAKVDTALLHYYFDTKRGLFDAVFARRAEIINKERIDSIDAYEKSAGSAITVEGVIDAFLQPILERAATGRSALAQLLRADRAGEQHAGVGRRDHGPHVRHRDSPPDRRAAQGAAGRGREGPVLELSLPVRRADADAVADRPHRPAVRTGCASRATSPPSARAWRRSSPAASSGCATAALDAAPEALRAPLRR